MVIVNVCGGLVSPPGPELPPLSRKRTVTVAEPTARSAGVYVSVPSGATAGWTENSPELSFETRNVRVCEDSFAGPGLMFVAQPATVCAPRSETEVWFGPAVKLGGSLTGSTVMV